MTNQLFGLEFCAVWQDIFYPHKGYEQVNFYKNRVFISLVGPSETENSQLIYRNNTYLNDLEMDLKLTEYNKLLAKRVYLLSYIDIFYKRCIVSDETAVHN